MFICIWFFAALQLFGALTPRILGQTKLREPLDGQDGDNLSMHNSVTAQELFSRHQDLAPFFLKQLRNYDSPASLVPILSMLSRVSPGLVE